MRFVLAPLLALLTAVAVAQEAQQTDSETFVPLTPINRTNPTYPARSAQSGNEGWVMLSFIVSETGEVEEPMIEDSSGVEAFEQAALGAVRYWRYRPATVDGEPVAQSMVKVKMIFAIEGRPATGVTREFQGAYRKIRQLLDAGDYAAAKPLLEELEIGGRHNLYEDALFWALQYGYLEGVQSPDADEKRRALELAFGYQEDYLPADMLVAVAQRLYVLQVQAIDFSAARGTFERLRDSPQAKQSSQHAGVIAELTPTYEQIERVIAGPQRLAVKGEIGRYDYWVHELMRRSFSMSNVSGRIDAVDVRCKRGTRRYATYPGDEIWQVPESWGDCGVYVNGERGTTFTFEEHPAGTPATPLAR
jgi:TonB family protein